MLSSIFWSYNIDFIVAGIVYCQSSLRILIIFQTMITYSALSLHKETVLSTSRSNDYTARLM